MVRRALLLGWALAVSAACATPPCDRPPVRAQFLSVNDVYQLDPDHDGRGGLARVATLVRRLRAETPHTLFALAGDTLSPSLLSTLFRGRQMVEAWNALGLDVATFGNHEFDFGPAALRERMAEARFVWLSANVRESGGRPFGGAQGLLRREWDGVRVAVVGLTLAETAHSSNAGPDVVFQPPLAAAQEALGGEADLRVALTHLPIAQDRALARAMPLHLILGGHDHDPMVHEEGTTLIVKAGADAINVGRVEYEVGCGGAVVGRRHGLLPVDKALPPAPDVLALAERYTRAADRELDQPVGATPRPLDAREGVLRGGEAPLGRFLAALMRERMGADVGLLNSGAIRGNRVIPAGPLTRRDFRALLPFDNTIVLVELSGAALREALERSVEALPRPAGSLLQTAGLDYHVDLGRPPGQRVGAVVVGGRALADGARYRVAVPDYLGRGGDGYAMIQQGRLLVGPEEGPGLIDTVFEAIGRGRLP